MTRRRWSHIEQERRGRTWGFEYIGRSDKTLPLRNEQVASRGVTEAELKRSGASSNKQARKGVADHSESNCLSFSTTKSSWEQIQTTKIHALEANKKNRRWTPGKANRKSKKAIREADAERTKKTAHRNCYTVVVKSGKAAKAVKVEVVRRGHSPAKAGRARNSDS